MLQAKNYRITTEWKPLSDIMDQEYDPDDNYVIHINTLDIANALCFTQRDLDYPEQADRGREYGQYQEIEVAYDTGDEVYLRALYEPIDIEIRVSGRR